MATKTTTDHARKTSGKKAAPHEPAGRAPRAAASGTMQKVAAEDKAKAAERAATPRRRHGPRHARHNAPCREGREEGGQGHGQAHRPPTGQRRGQGREGTGDGQDQGDGHARRPQAAQRPGRRGAGAGCQRRRDERPRDGGGHDREGPVVEPRRQDARRHALQRDHQGDRGQGLRQPVPQDRPRQVRFQRKGGLDATRLAYDRAGRYRPASAPAESQAVGRPHTRGAASPARRDPPRHVRQRRGTRRLAKSNPHRWSGTPRTESSRHPPHAGGLARRKEG